MNQLGRSFELRPQTQGANAMLKSRPHARDKARALIARHGRETALALAKARSHDGYWRAVYAAIKEQTP